MIYDDIKRTGLELVVDGVVKGGRIRAQGLDQCGMEIVTEQVQPLDVNWLGRDDVCRDSIRTLPLTVDQQQNRANSDRTLQYRGTIFEMPMPVK